MLLKYLNFKTTKTVKNDFFVFYKTPKICFPCGYHDHFGIYHSGFQALRFSMKNTTTVTLQHNLFTFGWNLF